MSCRLAVSTIHARTRRRYALKTIVRAGRALERLGVLTRTVRSRKVATVYHLLPENLRAVLSTTRRQAPPAQGGLVSKARESARGKSARDFSDEVRAAFW
jgi:hypothetical protein